MKQAGRPRSNTGSRTTGYSQLRNGEEVGIRRRTRTVSARPGLNLANVCDRDWIILFRYLGVFAILVKSFLGSVAVTPEPDSIEFNGPSKEGAGSPMPSPGGCTVTKVDHARSAKNQGGRGELDQQSGFLSNPQNGGMQRASAATACT